MTQNFFSPNRTSKRKTKPYSSKRIQKLKLIVQPPKLGKPLKCQFCGEYFHNNLDFAFHSKLHNQCNNYSCHLCDYRNPSKSLLEIHVRAHDGIKKYKCELCCSDFNRLTDAIEHKYSHTGDEPRFQCEICGKKFELSKRLASHRITTHYEEVTGKKLDRFDCKICNKHYAFKSGLTRHNSMHHKELGQDCSVVCDICGKRIATKDKLKYHLRIHTGDKPFICKFCKKGFVKKQEMEIHERVHTGEKPFTCQFCGKKFAHLAPFKYHIKTHTGEKNHLCQRCNKAFISYSNLKIHLRSCVPTQSSEPVQCK